MTDIRIIKKYPNRRLYDTAISSYVTLCELKELVLSQTPFRVVEVKSNADITRQTLLQIIQEQEEQGTPLFSTDVLLHAIRCYDNEVQAATACMLQHALKVLANKSWCRDGEQSKQDDPSQLLYTIARCHETESNSALCA